MEILTLIVVPVLIEPLVQWLKIKMKYHPIVMVSVISALGGTAFLAWQMAIPEGLKMWAATAYPIFAIGAVATHKYLRPYFEK